MSQRKYQTFYSLPLEQQDRMVAAGLNDLRHDGRWMCEEFLREWPGAIAVMQSSNLMWDAALPRLIETGHIFNIEPQMRNVMVIIYSTQKTLSKGDAFVNHIKSHLAPEQKVVCKICERDVDAIAKEARRGSN
jgi:hypothetical protein